VLCCSFLKKFYSLKRIDAGEFVVVGGWCWFCDINLCATLCLVILIRSEFECNFNELKFVNVNTTRYGSLCCRDYSTFPLLVSRLRSGFETKFLGKSVQILDSNCVPRRTLLSPFVLLFCGWLQLRWFVLYLWFVLWNLLVGGGWVSCAERTQPSFVWYVLVAWRSIQFVVAWIAGKLENLEPDCEERLDWL